jgi:hypothetical protein
VTPPNRHGPVTSHRKIPMSTTAAVADATAAGIPFTIASRPQRRFANVQSSISNLSAGGSFQVVQLPATGWVRKIQLFFTATYTTDASAAVVAGDGPWNLITGVTLTDATGQPVYQPISGYNLYILNKYLPAGGAYDNSQWSPANPHLGPEYTYTASSTSGSREVPSRIAVRAGPEDGLRLYPEPRLECVASAEG